MVSFLGKFVLTLLITNWIVAEIGLFWPSFNSLSADISRKVRIPTHNEWPDIIASSEATQLKADINGYLVSAGPVARFLTMNGNQSKHSSSAGHPGNSPRYFSRLEERSILAPPFLSGEKIFVRTL